MALHLPPPIAAYFAAEDAQKSDQLAAAFTEDGRVHDEKQTYEGREAITTWAIEAKRKYAHKAEPLSVSERAGAVVVRTRLTGQFPGSPIEVDHVFRLSGDKIQSLETG